MARPYVCAGCGEQMTNDSLTGCYVVSEGKGVVWSWGDHLHVHDSLILYKDHPKMAEVLRVLGVDRWPT